MITEKKKNWREVEKKASFSTGLCKSRKQKKKKLESSVGQYNFNAEIYENSKTVEIERPELLNFKNT